MCVPAFLLPKPPMLTLFRRSMTRAQGSWSARMDVEEESYFNASDDEDDSSSSSRPSSRKRENDDSEAGRKRPRLDSTPAEGGMTRSKTWPVGTDKGKGKGLVDYGEEDSDDEEPGGFVKEGAAAESSEVSTSGGSSTDTRKEEGTNGVEEEKPLEKEEESEPPFSRGELPRRKVDDDDDELSLLSFKTKKAPPKPLKAALSMSTGIKISFGSANLAKLAGAAEAKEESSDAG